MPTLPAPAAPTPFHAPVYGDGAGLSRLAGEYEAVAAGAEEPTVAELTIQSYARAAMLEEAGALSAAPTGAGELAAAYGGELLGAGIAGGAAGWGLAKATDSSLAAGGMFANDEETGRERTSWDALTDAAQWVAGKTGSEGLGGATAAVGAPIAALAGLGNLAANGISSLAGAVQSHWAD